MTCISFNPLMRTRVKVCGMTQVDDAVACVRAGVDALGFIFYPKSPRNVEFHQAAEIIQALPPFLTKVGVFVNADKETLSRAVDCGISCLQLHGSETIGDCSTVRQMFPGLPILKAIRVGDGTDDYSLYNQVVDGFVLDTYVKGLPGGTGETFNWESIDSLGLEKMFLLAGGLSVTNIEDAISSVRPFGVDVNSGIESSPGKKDHKLLEELMKIVSSTTGQ